MANRVFTDEELREMEQLTVDVIKQAIDDGQLEKAKGLIKRMHIGSMFMHDLYRDWIAALMTYIYDNYGEDALNESMKKAVSTYLEGSVKLHKSVDFRKRVEMFVGGFKGHGDAFKITEDDEKVTIQGVECPGHQLLKTGKYGPPCNFTMIQKPHAMTFNTTDFPVYCVHAPIQEQLAIDWIGEPVYISNPAGKMAEGPCQCLFYKDPKNIPDKVYERVGRKKPGS